jgi:hypothetical protein
MAVVVVAATPMVIVIILPFAAKALLAHIVSAVTYQICFDPVYSVPFPIENKCPRIAQA